VPHKYCVGAVHRERLRGEEAEISRQLFGRAFGYVLLYRRRGAATLACITAAADQARALTAAKSRSAASW
jgi:hypothetical protein